MVTARKSQLLASFVAVLATATFLVTSTLSATPESPATQPQVEVTAPTATPESKTVPASEQKNSEEPSKNGKNDKKKSRITGLMLALFAVITGHQGSTR